MIDVYKINSDGIYEDVFKINTEKNTYYDGEKWQTIDFTYVEEQPPYAKVVKWENDTWIIVEEYPVEPQPPQEPTEIEMIMLAIADLDMQREIDKTETQLAIAELAETILGGI